MKNLMLKVFIEILNANLQLVLKSLFKAYQFLGATLFMFLNIMYLIVWKLESIGEKGKVYGVRSPPKVIVWILNSSLKFLLEFYSTCSCHCSKHTILVKYQFLGATLYLIMYRIVWKLVNHMFLLVLMLLALLNNQLYFIILSPTDFATFLFWKVAVPVALLQNGYREHGKWWLSSKMFAS